MALSSKRFPRLVAGSYSLLLYLQIGSSRIRFVFYAFFDRKQLDQRNCKRKCCK